MRKILGLHICIGLFIIYRTTRQYLVYHFRFKTQEIQEIYLQLKAQLIRDKQLSNDGSRIVGGFNVDKRCMKRPWIVFIRYEYKNCHTCLMRIIIFYFSLFQSTSSEEHVRTLKSWPLWRHYYKQGEMSKKNCHVFLKRDKFKTEICFVCCSLLLWQVWQVCGK